MARRRRPLPSLPAPRGQRGYAYIALLIGIAIVGVAAAATIQLGALYQRRMAEKALLEVGGAFQRALLSYADATPAGLPRQPRTLEDLVRDPRYPNPVRHLRRVYADPLTGKADWVLVRSPDGQTIVGIHSASRARPIQLKLFPEEFRGFENRRSYTQWVFVARRPLLAVGGRAPNAGVPASPDGTPLPDALPPGGVTMPGGMTAGDPVAGKADDDGFPDNGWPSGDGFSTGGGLGGGNGFGSGNGFVGGSGFSNGGASANGGGFSNDGGFSTGGGFSTSGGFSGGGFSSNGAYSSGNGFSSGGGFSNGGFSSGYGANR
ncbi:hypothetical protein [Burkholderia gladioli]|uniref:hypothetical protein n=1 Tax=Burkholderia gladioli TaxID=28095 RepID=UPI00163F8B32|nr:hypothetical protein [Burkholderia gladioli]MDC6130364.1 hypothetical protein [Burkholderia gladioli]